VVQSGIGGEAQSKSVVRYLNYINDDDAKKNTSIVVPGASAVQTDKCGRGKNILSVKTSVGSVVGSLVLWVDGLVVYIDDSNVNNSIPIVISSVDVFDANITDHIGDKQCIDQ